MKIKKCNLTNEQLWNIMMISKSGTQMKMKYKNSERRSHGVGVMDTSCIKECFKKLNLDKEYEIIINKIKLENKTRVNLTEDQFKNSLIFEYILKYVELMNNGG